MMATVHAPRTGRHISGERILAIVLSLLAAAVVVAVVASTTTLPWVGGDTDTSIDMAPVSEVTRVHAAEVATAAGQLHALRVVASTPEMADALHEDVVLLELVVTGDLPVEAAQPAPVTSG